MRVVTEGVLSFYAVIVSDYRAAREPLNPLARLRNTTKLRSRRHGDIIITTRTYVDYESRDFHVRGTK